MEDKASDAVSAFEEDLENQIELFTGEGSTQMETIEANSEAASESLKEEDANILEMASQQETTGNLYTESAHRYYSESSYSSYTFTMLAVEFWLY